MSDEEKEERCASRRTVQLGRMAATDLRCTRLRWAHPGHGTSRWFGDVKMTAEWDGQWEEER